MTSSESRKTTGFTLVELLIVIAMIGLVITIGAPSFSGFVRENRLKYSARSVAVALQTARLKAISANRRCFVDFAPGSLTPADSFYTVWLDQDGDLAFDNGEDDSTYLSPPDTKGGFSGYKLPPGVSFGASGVGTGPEGLSIPGDGIDFGGNNKVGFTSRGLATIGAVFIKGESGSNYAVTVSGLGAVRTWRWSGSQWE